MVIDRSTGQWKKLAPQFLTALVEIDDIQHLGGAIAYGASAIHAHSWSPAFVDRRPLKRPLEARIDGTDRR